MADGTPNLEKINFIGHRYMIDKLLARGDLGRGAAIGFISSAAGLGWEANLPLLNEYLDISDFDAAAQWAQEHMQGRLHVEQAGDLRVRRARGDGASSSRASASTRICPGPTDTPLAQANKDMWLGFGADYRAAVGVEAATPLEQAYPLVFLCSDAAGAITGQTMITDSGYFAAGRDRVVPRRDAGGQLPPRPLLTKKSKAHDGSSPGADPQARSVTRRHTGGRGPEVVAA